MSNPDILYRVEVVQGGRPLRFREKGGGTFASWMYALGRYETLHNSGVHVRLLEAELNWKVLKDVEVE